MSVSRLEVRVCLSCGLRYPLAGASSFGSRCPLCLGETSLVSVRTLEERGTLEGRRESAQTTGGFEFGVLLDNIRSAWNVGSILRSADGFGFARAYLCGITPTPEVDAVRKTSLNAESYVAWSHHKNAVELAQQLKSEGWKLIALEEEERSQSIRALSTSPRTILILGSEISGVDPDLLDLADQIVHIPMRGQKRSFNVANAFSIAAYAASQAVSA